MQYRQLGNTDLKVSLICLGTMTFGEQNNEKEAHQQLDYAFSQGVNFIDTAEMYPVPPNALTYGKTESFIGRWLVKQQRDQLVIASKIAGPARGNDNQSYIRGGSRLLNSRFLPLVMPVYNGFKPIIWTFTNCTGRSDKSIFSGNWG